MAEFRARIGRIRMKNGGADVRVLPTAPSLPDRRGGMMKHTRMVIDHSEEHDPLVGHIVIGFFASGKSSVGFYHNPDTCPIPRALLPAWIKELVRRDLITEVEARDVFNEMFEWRDK
jgi:hypothetical protein